MRSVALLALCLGLFAVAQALEQTEGVLLKGLTADEDMFKNGNVSALRGHHHWRHGGHHHDHSDGPYWERRHSAKSELLRCLKHAHDDCNIDDAFSLRAAGKRIAHCLLDHLGGCHDVPGLAGDIRKTIPFIMAVQGFETLTETENGLAHASLVFQFYLAGASATVPGTTTTNPWFIDGGCASRLLGLLTTGCHRAGMKQIWALAEVVGKLIEQIFSGTDPNLGLGACAPDIPAVLVSLFTTTCPSRNYLYNPLVLPPSATSGNFECEYNEDAQFEKSPAALLGGSVYSLLLLSGNTRLAGLGVQVGFAALRFALAATQTTSFSACLDNTPVPEVNGQGLYTGELFAALQLIPTMSGLVGASGQRASTPLQLGPDGTRVICASIAMMSGNPLTEAAAGRTYTWQRNLMWQGAADVTNALFGTIESHDTLLDKPQKRGLCLAARSIYTFYKDASTRQVVAAPAIPPIVDPMAEYDWSCSTTQAPACAEAPPAWLTSFLGSDKPQLAAEHDFTPGTAPAGSPFIRVCTAAFANTP